MKRIRSGLSILSALLISSALPLATGVSAADVTHLRMTALTGPSSEGVKAALNLWNSRHPEIQVDLEVQSDEYNELAGDGADDHVCGR